MARPVPPLGRHLVSFGAVARCRAPHPGRAIQSSGVPAANGGARLRGRLRGSLPCSRRRRPVFDGGEGGGGVSFRSGVARSPVRGAVFAPGGRVAAGRGRVPPYGPPAGLGRNASPPGVPPSPVGGKRCGRWPRFEFAPADAGAGRCAGSLETFGFKQTFWSLLGLWPKVTRAGARNTPLPLLKEKRPWSAIRKAHRAGAIKKDRRKAVFLICQERC